MNPTQQGGQNPYASIIAQMQQRQQGGGQPTPQGGGMPSMMGGGGMGGQDAPQPAPQGGQTGGATATQDATKYLVSALQNLNAFVKISVDRQETTIGRSLISLITKLIEKDQQRQHQMSQGQPMGTSTSAQLTPTR